MPNKDYLMPECFTEKALLNILGFTENEIQKAGGKADVISKQNNPDFRNTLLIGLVDYDTTKNQPGNYRNYKPRFPVQHGFSVKQKINKPHYLIELHDNFEMWILSQNRKARVSAEDFNINTKILHQYASMKISDNYLDFIKEVMIKYPAPFNHLKNCIKSF